MIRKEQARKMSGILIDIGDPPPITSIVETAETLLELAKSGEIRSLAVAASSLGRCTTTIYDTGDGTIADLYLAIERVKLGLLDEDGT